MEFATHFYFAAYDLKSKTVKSITADTVNLQTKDREQNGVVFVLKCADNQADDIRLNNIKGESTKERIEILTRFYVRKRKKAQYQQSHRPSKSKRRDQPRGYNQIQKSASRLMRTDEEEL